MTDDLLKTYRFDPLSGMPPRQLVIFLHGFGADGRDLIGLAPEFAPSLPEALFLSPDAPFPCDMAPSGRQWFSLEDWSPDSLLRGVQNAAPLLTGYIAQQIEKHGVVTAKTALVGFSQGTMTALYAGPRYPEKLAGVLGYSGALIWEEGVDPETLHKIPVYLAHGEADMVVPVPAYAHAVENLTQAGFSVTGHTTPGLPHGIDGAGIVAGRTFLQRVLST
ncbi:MAG: phospholipase [Alphaproteobacteria bacterium]|nr:phospholipase [Alphaproteobacteria bacterium]